MSSHSIRQSRRQQRMQTSINVCLTSKNLLDLKNATYKTIKAVVMNDHRQSLAYQISKLANKSLYSRYTECCERSKRGN